MWTLTSKRVTRCPPLRTRWSWWVVVVVVFTLLQGQQGETRREARVHGSQCSYTLVVNEFDASKCPVMQADAQPGNEPPQHYPWQDSPDPSASSGRRLPYAPGSQSRAHFYRSARPASQRKPPAQDSDKEMGVLRSQVKELDGRLLEEMVRTRELNSTLSRQATALRKAEEQLGSYGSNFTAIYRAMVFVQRQLQKQRKINKSLNKKLSNVLLDVVEVNNVLTRGPASSSQVGQGKDSAAKDFQVHSVAKVRSCPGVTDKSTTFRG